MPTADFSNQAYVEDDPQSRMVLSQFGMPDYGDGADFGYSSLSYGSGETFEYGEPRSENFLQSVKHYHDYLHSLPHSHPMSGLDCCGMGEGFEGQLGFLDFSKLISGAKQTLSTAGKTAISQVTTSAKQQTVQAVSGAVKQVTSTPQAQQIAQVAETIKRDPVVAEALKDPAKAPAVLADVQKKAQEVVSAAVTTIAQNKIPSAVIGIGLLGAAYYFFFRRR